MKASNAACSMAAATVSASESHLQSLKPSQIAVLIGKPMPLG
jgi:hypothetical protein